MRILSFKIIFILFTAGLFAQSPHGKNFDIDCSSCHQTESWKVDVSKVQFDHSKTKFKLVGQHQVVDCKSCHTTLIFSQAKTDCFSCHEDIHQATVGFDCANCHTPTSWIVKDIIGIHQNSRFPLVGAHKFADCAQCHQAYSQLRFDVLSVDCYSCHAQDYNSAQSPNHLTANFSKDCQECHNISSLTWSASNVNHSFFPLVGGHALPSCYSCHNQGTFEGLTTECYSCHRSNYEATTNPNHISAGLPTTCDICHSISGWSPAQFNHNLTQFPLTGQHINVNCVDCHKTGYTGTPADCYSCHRSNYEATTDPNHISTGLPTTCDLCHSTSGWSPAQFNHNLTQFPLTGQHINVNCVDCHKTGYTGTPADCYSCHQKDYESVSDPNHVLQNFPKDCAVCHNTSTWGDATFDHNQSAFPLTGSHIQVSCADCHTSGYSTISTECVSCHQTNYQQAANPSHTALSLPTNCESCHTTNPGWTPATFNIHSNYYPLVGAHALINNCADCHKGNYTNTPNTCYDCHSTEFNSTTDPPHQLQNFSHDCTTCHNMNNWSGATFDHSFFPIGSRHSNVSCNECHSETNYQPQCLSCHLNDFLDKHNQGDRTDCWNCHSTSNWN